MKYLTIHKLILIINKFIYGHLTIFKTFFTTLKYLENLNLVSYNSQIVINKNEKKCCVVSNDASSSKVLVSN